MAGKLTKRRVDAAKAGETIWDGEIKGLGLRVWASGARSYVLKYRRGGVQRLMTIGKHGSPWTPGAARKEGLRLKRLIEEGRDPAGEKTQEREAETVADLAKTYLEKHAARRKTAAEYGRKLQKDILPTIGRLKAKDVTAGDIERLIEKMADRPYAANRCLALLSHLFKKAEAWGARPDNSNPCAHVERFAEKARERFLSPRELARLGRALAVVDRAGKAPYVVAALRLLIFTGARRDEILTLKWEYVDFERRLLRLPDSKTGAKTVALNAPAIEILATLPRRENNPFAICGAKDGRRLINLRKPWVRICKAALIEGVRIHDLRHSFASVAVAGGVSLPLIGGLLGHTQPQTTQRYAHLGDDPRLAAADAVGATIAARLRGEKAEVISLHKN